MSIILFADQQNMPYKVSSALQPDYNREVVMTLRWRRPFKNITGSINHAGISSVRRKV